MAGTKKTKVDETYILALWSLYKNARTTGALFWNDTVWHDYLVERGFIKHVGQAKWVTDPRVTGWQIYAVTDQGAAAIKKQFNRDIARYTEAGSQ